MCSCCSCRHHHHHDHDCHRPLHHHLQKTSHIVLFKINCSWLSDVSFPSFFFGFKVQTSHASTHHLHMLPFTTLCRHGMPQLTPGMWKGMAVWFSSAPEWWQKGWPRERPGSLAEAELLSQLAAVLKPRTPIRELFRSFPAPKGWGGHCLEPDLSVYGVLRGDAALFVEYDGYWRHGIPSGISRDKKKNAALLAYAPAGSCIVRIRHTKPRNKPKSTDVIWIHVEPWRSGSQGSLWKVLQCILQRLLLELRHCLKPQQSKRLEQQVTKNSITTPPRVRDFCRVAATSAGGNTSTEISRFLASEGFSRASIKLVERKLSLPSLSIDRKLQPLVVWLLSLGLSKDEIAKVIAHCPQILSCSVARNLKPTSEWFLRLGLSRHQLAKAVAAYPQVLFLSIEKNLRPTFCWFVSLGLGKEQLAHTIAYHPRVLGFSTQQKLGPTVQWFLDLGLSKVQMAQCVARFPQLIGLCVEGNLKFKVQLLQAHFATQVVVDMIARSPRILSYRHYRLKTRLEVLVRLEQTQKLESAMSLTDDRFQRRFLRKEPQQLVENARCWAFSMQRARGRHQAQRPCKDAGNHVMMYLNCRPLHCRTNDCSNTYFIIFFLRCRFVVVDQQTCSITAALFSTWNLPTYAQPLLSH